MAKILQKTADFYEARGRLDPAEFDRHVSFHTYAPPADLSLFIEHFWTISWDEGTTDFTSEEVMHRPYVDVFISAEYSGIQGTFRGKRAYDTSGSGRIIGIRFRPGAFHAFWDGALVDLQDKIIGIEEVFPEMDAAFIARLLAFEDEVIVKELIKLIRAHRPQLDTNIELINKIIAAVENDESLQTVKAVAKASGRSDRWLQQLFQDYVGIGLKWLLQRHKLLTAAEQIRQNDQPNWADIAYDLGYSSQQHFITDFKKVLGKTPLQYKKELTPRPRG
ncbi:MAG: helix-turn-helix transcriptional regulator [Candidatus Saccharimonadales bacterium]